MNTIQQTNRSRSCWALAFTIRLALACACFASGLLMQPDDLSARNRSKHIAEAGKRTIVRHAPAKKRYTAKAPEPAIETPSVTPETQPERAAPKLLSREEILASDADRLERVGRHLIVGYHSFSEVKALVEKRAIAGIFITDHNVRGRSAAEMRADIDSLQTLRAEQGMPPLVIAADQEGGQVSRLSPPLKKQMTLGRLLSDLPHDEERRKAVEDYAETQAAELKRIGVNLNFAPVVDLKLNPSNRDDGETKLRIRAIAADPYLVAKVAGWYCDKVAEAGIMCTLKHFPGLGRVARDTHVASGEISATSGELELNDWVPFRRVMSKPNTAMMLGHVRVGVVDKTTPASFSKPVIGELIRNQWNYDGLLITDDFCMGAVTGSKGGIGAAAVKAIDAGADLILVSYIEREFDTVISALLAADADSALDAAVAGASRERIARIIRAAAIPAKAQAE
jgi:beta-N-acetylhexosaminidase